MERLLSHFTWLKEQKQAFTPEHIAGKLRISIDNVHYLFFSGHEIHYSETSEATPIVRIISRGGMFVHELDLANRIVTMGVNHFCNDAHSVNGVTRVYTPSLDRREVTDFWTIQCSPYTDPEPFPGYPDHLRKGVAVSVQFNYTNDLAKCIVNPSFHLQLNTSGTVNPWLDRKQFGDVGLTIIDEIINNSLHG